MRWNYIIAKNTVYNEKALSDNFYRILKHWVRRLYIRLNDRSPFLLVIDDDYLYNIKFKSRILRIFIKL